MFTTMCLVSGTAGYIAINQHVELESKEDQIKEITVKYDKSLKDNERIESSLETAMDENKKLDTSLQNYSELNEQLNKKVDNLEKQKKELVKANKLKDEKISELKKQ
jgi:predicted nuclease with TOPRIM domain